MTELESISDRFLLIVKILTDQFSDKFYVVVWNFVLYAQAYSMRTLTKEKIKQEFIPVLIVCVFQVSIWSPIKAAVSWDSFQFPAIDFGSFYFQTQ